MRIKYFGTIVSLITIYFFLLGNNAIAQEKPAGSRSKENQEYYKIGPNDVLNIFVWNEPELTRDTIVMLDGRIILPMIGEIIAKGHSAAELKNIITEKYKNYINSPEVTVIVKQSNSSRIYTIGKVNKPGPYPLDASMTVLQALSVAGGFAEGADTINVIIVRRTIGKETMYRFNYQDFIAGKNLNQNLVLEPGDTIVVP